MPTDTQNEIAAGADRQTEVAASLPPDMPVAEVRDASALSGSASLDRVPESSDAVNSTLQRAREVAGNNTSGGNSNNDNNPYARRPAERDLAPHERRIRPEENVAGAPDPRVVQNLGDGGTMSGLFDAAGNALTIAVADATISNNTRAANAAKQPDNVVHRTVNGHSVQWPANTPAV